MKPVARLLRSVADRLDPRPVQLELMPISEEAALRIQRELLRIKRRNGGRGLGLS